MPLMKNGKIRLSFKLTLSFCVVFSIVVLVYTQSHYYNYKRERCQILSHTASTMFQSDMMKNIGVNDIIDSLLTETDGNLSKFDKIVEKLIAGHPSIERIQIAPNGIVTESFPPSVYDKKGRSIFETPVLKEISNIALNKKEPYLLGPLPFDSGKIILIAGKPIFLEGPDKSEFFWGFSIIHLGLSNLFSKNSLDFLDNSGYVYSLWRTHPKTGEIHYLAKNTTMRVKNPCETVFAVADSWWTLSTAPKDGWFNIKFISIEIAIALMLSLFISLGTVFVLSIKDREAALENLSYRDSLTNLYNARKFLLTLKEFQISKRPYSLIYLDLNSFKSINDNLGHEAGDRVLLIVARKLSNCIKEGDTAFRIGGDEFTIILAGANGPKFVEEVIARIKASVERETVLENSRLRITCSTGYAICPDDGYDFEELIKIADKNMYLDKKNYVKERSRS